MIAAYIPPELARAWPPNALDVLTALSQLGASAKPTSVDVNELRKLMVTAPSKRTVYRRLNDLEDAGVIEVVGRTEESARIVRIVPAAVLDATEFFTSRIQCRHCRRLRNSRNCKKCRVKRRRDLAQLIKAVAEARKLKRAGKSIPVVSLSVRFEVPLWTTESFAYGRTIPLQGLVRRLLREDILEGEEARLWRKRERNAVRDNENDGDELEA